MHIFIEKEENKCTNTFPAAFFSNGFLFQWLYCVLNKTSRFVTY